MVLGEERVLKRLKNFKGRLKSGTHISTCLRSSERIKRFLKEIMPKRPISNEDQGKNVSEAWRERPQEMQSPIKKSLNQQSLLAQGNKEQKHTQLRPALAALNRS